jgi:hypothetical protein
MKIIIQTNNVNNMIFSIDIEEDKKIRDLKTKIWLLTDIPFTYQELWYNETLLVNDNPLEDYHILMDSKLTMVIKIKKH